MSRVHRFPRMIAQNSVFESKNLRKNLSMTNFTDLLFNHLTTPNHHDLPFFLATPNRPHKTCEILLAEHLSCPAFAQFRLLALRSVGKMEAIFQICPEELNFMQICREKREFMLLLMNKNWLPASQYLPVKSDIYWQQKSY